MDIIMDALDRARRPNTENLDTDGLKKLLPMEGSVVKNNRRYFKVANDDSDMEQAKRKAIEIIYPEYDTTKSGITEILLALSPIEKKLEIWDDKSVWVRTILL